MTVNDLYELMIRFKDNDFAHLDKRVDKTNDRITKLIWLGISTLATMVVGLVLLLVKG